MVDDSPEQPLPGGGTARPEKIELIKPRMELKGEFLSMARELLSEDERRYRERFELALKNFAAYILELENHSRGRSLPPGWVPCTTFWLVRDGKTILGSSVLRRRLTPDLELEGGHIGYTIRPSERKKGYGTKILELTLEKAREIGLERVLITCDTDNVASAKIIRKNGGKFEGESISKISGKPVSRYWIDLN